TMTRWHTGSTGETARLLILAAAALEDHGVATGQARKHIVYASAKRAGLGTMILSGRPIAPEQLARVEATCKASGFDLEVSPSSSAEHPQVRYVDSGPYSDLVAGAAENRS